jgi:hypothetical protein
VTDAALAPALEHFARQQGITNERLSALETTVARLIAALEAEPPPSKIEPLLQQLVHGVNELVIGQRRIEVNQAELAAKAGKVDGHGT